MRNLIIPKHCERTSAQHTHIHIHQHCKYQRAVKYNLTMPKHQWQSWYSVFFVENYIYQVTWDPLRCTHFWKFVCFFLRERERGGTMFQAWKIRLFSTLIRLYYGKHTNWCEEMHKFDFNFGSNLKYLIFVRMRHQNLTKFARISWKIQCVWIMNGKWNIDIVISYTEFDFSSRKSSSLSRLQDSKRRWQDIHRWRQCDSFEIIPTTKLCFGIKLVHSADWCQLNLKSVY